MKLKWRHIGLLPGLAVLALGLWCFVDMGKAGGSGPDPWYIIPIDLLLSILPGTLLLGVYWWALRTAQLERGRDIVLARGYLLLGLGVFGAVYWFRYHGYISAILAAGCLAPGVMVAAAGYWCRAKESRARVVVPVITFALLVAMISLPAYLFDWGISPVVTTATYGNLLKSDRELTNHFPREIPRSAKHVRLYYHPRFMQGGSHFEVRYEATPEELSALLNKYTSKALAVYDGSPDLFHYVNEIKGYPTAEFRDEANTTDSPLPSDFKVMVLGSKPRTAETWNHNYTSGIAISMKRREVIYWADRW